MNNNILISNNTPLRQSTQTAVNNKIKKLCNECNIGLASYKNLQLCFTCYTIQEVCKFKKSGNKIIDDFIRYTQIDYCSHAEFGSPYKSINYKQTNKNSMILEFVPYDQFKNVEFIAEGGFSKIYKATWIDGPIFNLNFRENTKIVRHHNYIVVLKKLNDSKNITSKNLNELKVFYDFTSAECKENTINILEILNKLLNNNKSHISEYFGITQDPISQDIMIIMPYYDFGDLKHYVSNYFYNICWQEKLENLSKIITGLKHIHGVNIVHRDLHSGNIFFNSKNNPNVYLTDYYHNNSKYDVIIGDLGINKSSTESAD
ncbi:hypothetical protein RirG_001550 [Rhizophagus irregularis DAOM 197198w]|nr:hypothetical protein RirG_001550 [Rhizophagus irregularis DAOM 197198w]